MKSAQIYKGLILVSILIGVSLYPANSQEKIRIRKDVNVDTLSLLVNYPIDFDVEKQARYDEIMGKVTKKANSKFSFHTGPREIDSKYSIVIEMGSIIYTTKKDDLNSSLYNILFFGGHAAMITTLGWTLPVLILWHPNTTSKINIYTSENLTEINNEQQSKILSNGYFASEAKQDRRFEKKFEKSMYNLVKYIDKQNVRNNKEHKTMK